MNSDHVFRSEKDFSIMSLLVILMGFITFQSIYQIVQHPLTASYSSLVIALLINAMLIWLIASTKYQILGDKLVIFLGPIKKSIAISEITDIAPSKNIISSPALSFNRLVINYKGGFIYISPERRELFLRLLLAKNPLIVVNN